jgi:hypothetical protein
VKVVVRLSLPKAAFVYPVPPAPPTAVLVSWFGVWPGGNLSVFAHGWNEEAAAYQPAAIAGTWPKLESVLAAGNAFPTHAVIVVARPHSLLLTSAQRQRLWSAFGVPIFEQIIGDHGTLLAAECEAHAGLHVGSPKLEIAGFSLETAPCGCGRDTPRIIPARQVEGARAAYARS